MSHPLQALLFVPVAPSLRLAPGELNIIPPMMMMRERLDEPTVDSRLYRSLRSQYSRRDDCTGHRVILLKTDRR